MNLKEIQQFVKKVAEKFPETENALDILARLTEEAGEVASEIRKIEKKGSKVRFELTSNKEKLADELVDVLNVIASIANLYDLDIEAESDRRNMHIKKVLEIED
ncbi:MAG: nucleotide pyrophosphohydrolase [Candidatus Portnoybacteria bacterium CG06_land_8_20_14_3_00_39_12]|uniref:Nucleotide pyrophosphohydrolase n=1 Tax=Candidatus Portnoybacteria bacterium CG06_land_8_20_14_3_00_39_12 TaxID=1974809 RepID=A0A2M7AXX1_9BACT|nr:MAG: nucleotide pyrophosphohydrolase [Candidatus Portnoybacteria bacterium CG06_land_8_20_14_3_00_39_12]